jgi:tetratricopeptide (TPR) repeat protein
MPAHRWQGVLAAALLLLAPFVVYAPLRSAGFVWDDDQNVVQNMLLRDRAGLRRIWLDPRASQQYYPVTHSSFWLETQLWGVDARPFHFTNVLLHALNGLLLWRVLLLLGLPGAYLAALVFAVHPVMTESVAWITERKNVLSLALALGALATYLRFAPPESERVGARRFGLYALSLGLFVLALLAKTVVCSLPAAILVIRWWKHGRIRAGDLLLLLPFFVLGAAAGLFTAWLEQHHVGAVGTEWALTPVDRLLIGGRALWFYAGKLVWPHPLIFFYPRWQIDPGTLWQFVPPVAAVAAAAVLWAARGRIGRGPLAAGLLYAGILLPALGFFDVYAFRYSFVADHFQYHASPALLALFAAVGAQSAERLGAQARNAARGVAAGMLVTLGALTFMEAREYRDLETLYRSTIAANPEAWNAQLNLANHLSSTGRNQEALPLAREAVRLAPRVADAHNTLGAALYLTAVESPALAPSRLPEAIEAFANALSIAPDHLDALHNGAVALGAAGRHAEAAGYYARVLELEPADVDARVGLGRSLLMLGRRQEAEAQLREALRREPGRTDAQQALAAATGAAGMDRP